MYTFILVNIHLILIFKLTPHLPSQTLLFFLQAITAWAPLIKPNTDPFPYAVAEAIGTTMNLIGQGESWAPTKEATFEESYAESNFVGASTTSYTRWSHTTKNCRDAKDTMYNGHLGQCK